MATATSKLLFRGWLGSMPTTLYVPPINATVIITNIVVANASSTPEEFYININGVPLLSQVSIDGNTSAFFDLKTVLEGSSMGADIQAWTTGMAVTIHISGVEII